MDLSNFNFSTVLMLAMAIALAYSAIKIFSDIIIRVVCIAFGIVLLVFVLTQLGITIPLLSEAVDFFFKALGLVFENLKELLIRMQG